MEVKNNPPCTEKLARESSEQEMNIYLKVVKTIPLKVKSSDTVKNLKEIIHQKEGVSDCQQDLYFTGEVLKDDNKLVDCGITPNSTLHLYVQNHVVRKLFVRVPSMQKTIVVEAKSHHTIEYVKSIIRVKLGIQAAQYSLIYCGYMLQCSMSLDSLGVKEGSTLLLVFHSSDVMFVYVKIPSGQIVRTQVNILWSVKDFREVLGSVVDFQVTGKNITYEGSQLDDTRSLASYDIKENSMLEVMPSQILILIKSCNGKTFNIYVHQRETVTEVVERINSKMGTKKIDYYLSFSGRRLEAGRELGSYGIKKGSTLHMVALVGEKNGTYGQAAMPLEIQILIKSCTGETFALVVNQRETVSKVAERINQKMGSAKVMDWHYLLYSGRMLEGCRSLASYGIEKDSTLHMVARASCIHH